MGRPRLPCQLALARGAGRALTTCPSHPAPQPRRQEPPIRFFASSHRIDQLSPRTRWLLVFLLLGIVLQAASGLIMHHRGPGWTPESVAAHYRGHRVDPAELTAEQLDLALSGDPTWVDRPPREFDALLDVAHMHLAFMPLIVFLVAHLFSMAPFARAPWAGALCYSTFLAAFADIALPFAIRYLSPAFSAAKILAVVILGAGLIGMGIACLLATLRSLLPGGRPDADPGTQAP